MATQSLKQQIKKKKKTKLKTRLNLCCTLLQATKNTVIGCYVNIIVYPYYTLNKTHLQTTKQGIFYDLDIALGHIAIILCKFCSPSGRPAFFLRMNTDCLERSEETDIQKGLELGVCGRKD